MLNFFIPRLHLEVLALGLQSHFLQFLALLDSRRLIGIYQLVQQSIYAADITGHTTAQYIVGVSLEAQELGNLTAQVDKPLADFKIVLRVVVYALRIVGHIHLSAQFALGRISHKR